MNTKISDDMKNLVIIRLETLPTDKKVSIGPYGEFDKEELINHVKKEDNVGRKIIKIELEFLRALKRWII